MDEFYDYEWLAYRIKDMLNNFKNNKCLLLLEDSNGKSISGVQLDAGSLKELINYCKSKAYYNRKYMMKAFIAKESIESLQVAYKEATKRRMEWYKRKGW